MPAVFWLTLGIIQIVLALTLIISVWGRFSKLTSPVAIALAVIALSGSFLYSAYAGFPGILWALIPAALFAFIVYKK
jgi:fumarate reductase subunit C